MLCSHGNSVTPGLRFVEPGAKTGQLGTVFGTTQVVIDGGQTLGIKQISLRLDLPLLFGKDLIPGLFLVRLSQLASDKGSVFQATKVVVVVVLFLLRRTHRVQVPCHHSTIERTNDSFAVFANLTQFSLAVPAVQKFLIREIINVNAMLDHDLAAKGNIPSLILVLGKAFVLVAGFLLGGLSKAGFQSPVGR